MVNDTDLTTGSPPYTWGALRVLLRCIAFSRITPIYMGSTVKMVSLKDIQEDHPHIHGEHQS